MKTAHSINRRPAFTLIELLVVITIIGILASMAFPVITGVMEKARKVRVLATIKDLQVGIKGYQTEYNRYPAPAGADATIITGDSGKTFLAILLGSDSQTSYNGRGIKFIELPLAKNGRGGLVGTDVDSYQLVDEWGYPYTVVMDTDGDDRVMNPDTSNDDPKISAGSSPQLPIGIIIYSRGPDGKDKEKPTKDDITSWRG